MAGTTKPDLTTSRVWANGATGGSITDPGTTKYGTGWILNEVPEFPDFNFLQQQFTQGLVYNNEQGINGWDTNTVYPVGAFVKGSDGFIYRALIQQNGNDPTSSPTNWTETQLGLKVNTLTTTTMTALTGLVAGRHIVETKEFSTGNGAGGIYDVVITGTTAGVNLPDARRIIVSIVDATICFVLRRSTPLNANQFDIQIAPADNTADIQAALDNLSSGPSGGAIISLQHNLNYNTSGAGLIVPPNIILDCNGALITYSGTGSAFTLGNSDSVLSFSPKLLNLNLKLSNKTSKGVRLRATRAAIVEGEIEGFTTVIDNTRTNIGLHIDGVNVSSFFNEISLRLNHVHEGFRIQTTGTVQSTDSYFRNCTVFGDQVLDNTSIGYNIGGGTVSNEGQGSVIFGGNVEKVNVGFLVGANAGSVTVDGVRIEIDITGTAWKFDFIDGCDPWNIKGVNGLGTTYMESASGIRNWDSAPHILLTDDAGSMRLGGFDAPLNAQRFLGLGGTTPSLQFDADSDFATLNRSGTEGTGRIFRQPGRGSGGFGAYDAIHGNSRGIGPGDYICGPSSTSGVYKITKGLDGATHFQVDPQNGRVFMIVPTSPVGLSAGDVWNNAGILTIV